MSINIGNLGFPRAVGTLAIACMLAGLNNTAYGWPPSAISTGNSCKTCHGSTGGETDRAGALQVVGEGMLDLDVSRNDGATRGAIPFFTVAPGDTVELTMNVLDGSDKYAVQLKRLETAGVLGPASTDFLTGYGADVAWFAQGPLPATYFTSVTGFGPVGTSWGGGPDPYSFFLTVDANTPINTYDLEYAVAGKFSGGKFYGDKHFYLNVIPEPATLVLMSLAGLGIATMRQKRQLALM